MAGTKIPDKGLESLIRSEKPFFTGANPKTALAGAVLEAGAIKTQAGSETKAPPVPQTQEAALTKEGGEQRIVARELFRQAAADMGFPRDTLSSTLLAFARFFSISLSPALLGKLRKESLRASSPGSPKTAAAGSAAERPALEAKALALVSALDKGVQLSPGALERYAGFLEVVAAANAQEREDLPTAAELQSIAEEQVQEEELLELLNRLPGKNGQYWMLFPFKINIRGIDLRVFLRILKRGASSTLKLPGPEEGELLIADIIGPKKQWSCFLKRGAAKLRADIRVYPEYQPRALKALEKEAKRLLVEGEGLFEEVLVKNGVEEASWAEELCSEYLLSINKKV